MVKDDGNGRTHEPNLREVTADLDGLRALLDERDRRYSERDAANKDAVKSALAAAEKAAEKTEMALKEYKTSANEWRDTVKDLVGNMVTRADVDRELKVIEIRLDEIRQRTAIGAGKSEGMSAMWGFVLSGVTALVGLISIGTFVFVTLRQPPEAPQIIYAPAPYGTLLPTTPPQATPGR